MMKIERTKIQIEIYGEVVEATKPSVKELEDIYAKLEGTEPKDARGVWCELLMAHGFTRDLLDSLETEHFLYVVEVIQGTKKKSPTIS